MANNRWDVEEFGSGLTVSLVGALAAVRDTAALAMTVAQCAAAAEAICCGRPMACTPGCPHCCVLNVAILLPEGMIIADWMRKRLLPLEIEEVKKSLAVHRSWARWMDDEERIIKKMACPLVDAVGSCSVHPVRPLACRGVTSLDSNSCREAFSPVITDEVRLVPVDQLRKDAYDAAFMALAECLRCHGLDDRSIELGSGVLAFLERPELREIFISGGKLPKELWL